MIPPSGKEPEQGFGRDRFGAEACGGGVEVLGFFLGFSIFIGIFGVGFTSRGCPRGPQARGRAPQACGSLSHLLAHLRCSVVLFWSIKNHRKFSAHSENLYFCTKNNTTVVLLKTASVRVSSNKIIPKSYRIIVNMA